MDAQCVLLLCYVLSTWHISPITQIVFKKLVNTCGPSLRSSGDIRAERAVSSGSVPGKCPRVTIFLRLETTRDFQRSIWSAALPINGEVLTWPRCDQARPVLIRAFRISGPF